MVGKTFLVVFCIILAHGCEFFYHIEKDFYNQGEPVYLIEHDFNCTKADNMNYKLMAERTSM